MMLRKIGLVAGAVTLVASLAACDFTADGRLECRTAADGKVVCTASGTGTPSAPPVTDPPGSEEPAPDPEPQDPNEGLPAAAVNAAQSGPDKVRVWWTTQRTDITGWRVERDGVDSSGYGTWGTDLPRATTDVTFNLLNPGAAYTFTVTGKTADGDLPPVSRTVTVTAPGRGPEPEPTTPPAAGDTAAARFGWGTPRIDEQFNYVGAPNSAIWHQAGECWPGHAGNGKRCASNSRVDGQKLVQTGEANGDSGWIAQKFGQQYGRWEARVRSSDTGSNAFRYHPLLIIWPDSNRWPQDGEYDFLENGIPGAACAETFIHYPHPGMPVQQEFKRETNCGAPLSEWHNVAFEWTPNHVKGFIDGREWFSFSGGAGPGGRSAIQAMPSGHLTIQLDAFHGTGPYRPASYEVDWVKTYALR